ncbi:MAG: 3-deoxy-manno-octulosonate cytidylyltransferase (CMP-KDO synthetase) [Verrucomicrobiales bacterium]
MGWISRLSEKFHLLTQKWVANDPIRCEMEQLAELSVSVSYPINILGVIPARWASSRFPGKPLHLIAGKPLVQHVWERCEEADALDSTIVATEDERIRDCVEGFGGRVCMTSTDHQSGTDRVAEAAALAGDYSHVINVQGDEPLIAPGLINSLAECLRMDSKIEMITAANPLTSEEEFEDPNVVKVVIDGAGNALYFSRSAIPFRRNAVPSLLNYRHNGIYGFSSAFLRQFVSWPPSALELSEGLEQLRALENGARIKVVVTAEMALGVDTPEQAVTLEEMLLNRPQSLQRSSSHTKTT